MKKVLARAAATLALLVLALVAVLAWNTLRFPSRQLPVPAGAPVAVDADAAARRLAGALRFRTVSSAPPKETEAEFDGLHAYLQRTFPRAHAALRKEVVNGHALLYTWEGSDPALRPMLLMAHQDVVPADPRDWKVDPFAGEIRDGYVWGRGAWDNKSAITGHMEAVEMLLAQGFRPRQTILFAYGHDEETHGEHGAVQIAALLKARGVRLDFVLDEGMVVTEGIVPGVKAPVALVGVAEKGYLSVRLRAIAAAGHSLMPPARGTSAIAVLGEALRRMEERPMPGEMRQLTRATFETLAPEMAGANRVVLSNLWLFRPVVERQLRAKPVTNAMVATTMAFTMLEAGMKENVMPAAAEATVNFRLLPGDRRDDVLRHVREVVADLRVEVTALPGSSEASPVTPTDSTSWQRMNLGVRSAFPDAVVAPGLVLGGTDARHFAGISDHIYRFSPVRVRDGDADRIHGSNERLAVANYAELIRFYHHLLLGAAEPRKD